MFVKGGPIKREITATGAGTGYNNSQQQSIPDSGNKGISGIAKDFHARHFKNDKMMNGHNAA